MRYSFILLILAFSSCTGQDRSTAIEQHRSMVTPLSSSDSSNEKLYPEEIKRLGVQTLYDKTKWYLYCVLYKQKLKFRSNVKSIDSNFRSEVIRDTNITYGMLPMRLENVIVRNDSVEIHMRFYYDDILISGEVALNVPELIGCVYQNSSNEEIVLEVGRGVIRYLSRGCKHPPNDCIPFENKIIVPEVKKYLIANKSKVDPWFYREAIKRDVINE